MTVAEPAHTRTYRHVCAWPCGWWCCVVSTVVLCQLKGEGGKAASCCVCTPLGVYSQAKPCSMLASRPCPCHHHPRSLCLSVCPSLMVYQPTAKRGKVLNSIAAAAFAAHHHPCRRSLMTGKPCYLSSPPRALSSSDSCRLQASAVGLYGTWCVYMC